MHRRTRSDLLPLETELERTLRNLKKERVAKAVMAQQREGNRNIPAAVERP